MFSFLLLFPVYHLQQYRIHTGTNTNTNRNRNRSTCFILHATCFCPVFGFRFSVFDIPYFVFGICIDFLNFQHSTLYTVKLYRYNPTLRVSSWSIGNQKKPNVSIEQDDDSKLNSGTPHEKILETIILERRNQQRPSLETEYCT